MLSSLPPEILDLVTDYLRDELTTLKTCCLVSKSWIQRTRKHLFASIRFRPLGLSVGSWKNTFPDPMDSPARHTRTLSIHQPHLIKAAHMDTISTFHRVVCLNVIAGGYGGENSLVPLHGFSPVLRSLRLASAVLPDSKLFDLVCSFPLLEDLALISHDSARSDEGRSIPSTSPGLTGSLELDAMLNGIHSTTRRLLDLPNGLHFTTIVVKWFSEHDVRSTTDLVSGCSETLQTLDITSYLLDVPETTAFDLSRAMKLRDVVFRSGEPKVEWITRALCTVESKHLQHMSLELPPYVPIGDTIWEGVRQEWLDLDYLLVKFWTSHSLRSKVMDRPRRGGKGMKDYVAGLFPELTKRGILDLVL